jgi:hypothetical protein
VQRKRKLKKPAVHLSALGLGVFDLQNRIRIAVTHTKEGEGPTGFFVLCCKFGLETVLHIGEFALQLLPDPIKVLDLASVIFNFRLGIALLNDLQYIGQSECYEITVN